MAGLVSHVDVVKAYLENPELERQPAGAVMTPREELIRFPNSGSLLEGVKHTVDQGLHQPGGIRASRGGSLPIGVLTLADATGELRNEIGSAAED